MMGGELDKFRELSDKELEKLRAMAETSPVMEKNLAMYEQISGRSLSAAAREAQEENDRRWDFMVADHEKMPKEAQPKTMGAFSDLLMKYGFKIPKPVPPDDQSKEGHFGDFMDAYGSQGMDLLSEYEMKEAPRPEPKCEQCRQHAGMRCKQCGEHYCSRECQKKAWPSHKKICKLGAAQRTGF